MSRRDISHTQQEIERAQSLLYGIKDGAPKALYRSLNRGIAMARTDLVREVREEYEVKAGDVRKTMTLTRATASRLEASVTFMGSPISLGSFNVRPKTQNPSRRTPIRVSVRTGSAPTSLDKGFILRTGGKPSVFERVGQSRLPIRRLYGPSVPQMVGNDRVVDRVADKAQENLTKRLDHEINRLIGGAS